MHACDIAKTPPSESTRLKWRNWDDPIPSLTCDLHKHRTNGAPWKVPCNLFSKTFQMKTSSWKWQYHQPKSFHSQYPRRMRSRILQWFSFDRFASKYRSNRKGFSRVRARRQNSNTTNKLILLKKQRNRPSERYNISTVIIFIPYTTQNIKPILTMTLRLVLPIKCMDMVITS